MKDEAAIAVRGLVRRFKDLVAVGGIDLDVPVGRCLGLLGPNGAGKTTTIEMLEGLSPPDEGSISILGLDWKKNAHEIRERIGVQLQETRLMEKLNTRETLRLFRSFYARGRDIDEVMELVGLNEKATTRVVHLSGGQQQRLSLGCALVNEPEILFLDEPTTGLDPQARRRVWEIVDEFKHSGGTVLITTHYMDEAERLADDLAIVDHGKLIAQGTPKEIIDGLGLESIIDFEAEDSALNDEAYAELPGVSAVRREQGRCVLEVQKTGPALHALLDLFKEKEIAFEDLRTHRPTLEDVFISMTGKQLRDG